LRERERTNTKRKQETHGAQRERENFLGVLIFWGLLKPQRVAEVVSPTKKKYATRPPKKN